jgi:hypothetical protein
MKQTLHVHLIPRLRVYGILPASSVRLQGGTLSHRDNLNVMFTVMRPVLRLIQ